MRISKAGFQPIEPPDAGAASLPAGSRGCGAAGHGARRRGPRSGRFGLVAWARRLLDRKYEVTNRQFKAFVDQGGYLRRDYWRSHSSTAVNPSRGKRPSNDLATPQDSRARNVDIGTYPDGQADFPVGGVSWYEAAAYAAFAGKSLPTIHHWYLRRACRASVTS